MVWLRRFSQNVFVFVSAVLLLWLSFFGGGVQIRHVPLLLLGVATALVLSLIRHPLRLRSLIACGTDKLLWLYIGVLTCNILI
ncbi:MAG: hypothetical protein WC628_03830, partial [Candidatus Omnitrophota bacterium]